MPFLNIDRRHWGAPIKGPTQSLELPGFLPLVIWVLSLPYQGTYLWLLYNDHAAKSRGGSTTLLTGGNHLGQVPGQGMRDRSSITGRGGAKNGKGPSINYVRIFTCYLDPLPPPPFFFFCMSYAIKIYRRLDPPPLPLGAYVINGRPLRGGAHEAWNFSHTKWGGGVLKVLQNISVLQFSHF